MHNPRTTLADPRNGEGFSMGRHRDAVCAGEYSAREQWTMREWLDWTYRRQQADAVYRQIVASVGPAGVRSSLLAAVRVAALGVRVDCSGSAATGGADLAPEAEWLHEAVLRLPAILLGQMVHYGKTGVPPDWVPDADTAPRPVLNGRGAPVMLYHPIGRRPIACRLDYADDPRRVASLRAAYGEWHAALVRLGAAFGLAWLGQAVAPGEPVHPWINGVDSC